MITEKLIDNNTIPGISGAIFAHGDFGIIDGVEFTKSQTDTETVFEYQNTEVLLTSVLTRTKNGAVIRKDCLKNISDRIIEINGLCSRFRPDGNSYDVYTQYNSWQHESEGKWQKLITSVTAESLGIRTCEGATPMMALHNLYTEKNYVFHLLPNAQWKMTAKKFPRNQKEIVVVETGFNNENLRLKAYPGETIELPTVIFYEADCKTDLDAWKLHEVYNNLYPRAKMPVLYNSWLYCFDDLNIDELLKQADCAAELGVEAFMIDAGWFGEGEVWWKCVGDWKENTVSGPAGRLIEISNRVRERGMIFGLWFEPERAAPTSKAVKEHPDYYIEGKLLDFSNPKALEFIFSAVSEQIEKYNIGWLKFDFNDTIPLDPSGQGFYRYLQGQKKFVEKIKERFPGVYITNCASGGYRMELCQGSFTDSFWLSDNQGPLEGIRILKDTLKRMPTCLIERWNVQKHSEGFPRHGYKEKVGVMFSCNNATWDYITTVNDSFTEQFINCGPFGFSCDIVSFPDEYKNTWKKHIARFKEEREFYMKASARILADSEGLIAIEYADTFFDRCVIQLFTKTVYAGDIILYPAVDTCADYTVNGKPVSGKDIALSGIYFDNLTDNSCRTVEIVKDKR
ncbi:MAG: alpha-galactosidase [Clostridia bacterium]|nr:alpha-galactosidase [Clostridia bacterium]